MRALTIGVVVALAASAPAFAGGKGGGGGSGHTSTEAPKSSTSLNYNKVELTYKPQKPDGTNATAAKKGKVNVKDISVTKKTDKSSATLNEKHKDWIELPGARTPNSSTTHR